MSVSAEAPRRVWEHFAHGADVGIRGIGPTLDAAFEEAARALIAVIADPDSVRPAEVVFFELSAPDLEVLFTDWINALIGEMATRRMLFGRFVVRVEDHHLNARAWGEPLERRRHRPALEVKGATFTELAVRRDPVDQRWRAQCVVDV